VKVTEKDGDDEFMELPREKDGTVLLSTIQAQFPDAIGLKYKSSSGAWRGIRAEDNILEAPHGGWGDTTYVVTQTDPSKKKSDEGKRRKKTKLLGDLIVFGLPFTCQNEDLKEYFENTCGQVEFAEVKLHHITKKSRGFGFIRFKTEAAAKEALKEEHEIEGRKLTVKLSEKKTIPIKLFVGRLPKSTNQLAVKEYFEEYGEMSDVFVPHERGFAFITFESEEDGRECLKAEHMFEGYRLKVVVAEPREHERGPPPRGGASRDGAYGSSSYGGSWKQEPSTRVRERSNERYDKYSSDRHDDRRNRSDRFDRHAGSFQDDRRRGREAPLATQAASAQKDIASELKTMLFSLLSNQKR